LSTVCGRPMRRILPRAGRESAASPGALVWRPEIPRTVFYTGAPSGNVLEIKGGLRQNGEQRLVHFGQLLPPKKNLLAIHSKRGKIGKLEGQNRCGIGKTQQGIRKHVLPNG